LANTSENEDIIALPFENIKWAIKILEGFYSLYPQEVGMVPT
jgi:hypothetical protein